MRTTKTFRTLMAGELTATILSLTTNHVVRGLTVKNEDIEVDAFTEKVTVPLDTPIIYEPWFMDRGSLLFEAPGFGKAKLATEFDTIKFPNGEMFVMPNPEEIYAADAESYLNPEANR